MGAELRTLQLRGAYRGSRYPFMPAVCANALAGGVRLFCGYQLSQWALAKSYLEQVAAIRQAYDEATEQRDQRLDELTRTAESAATKASKAATTATQAADKADEALNRVSP